MKPGQDVGIADANPDIDAQKTMTITKVKSVNKRWLTVDEYYSDNGLALVSMDAKHPLGTFDYTFRKDGELKVSTVKLFGGEVPITSFA